MPDGVVKSLDDRLAPRFDKGRHHRAKLGFVLLSTEQTVQDDALTLCPEGVGMHFARLPNDDEITVETLAAQADHLAPAAKTLPPDGSIDVVGYACTSGSLVIGEDRVFAELKSAQPRARTSSIITGVMEALRAVGARRVVAATPYLDEVNAREADYMIANGFDVLEIQGLNLEKDSQMVTVTPDFLLEFGLAVNRPDADAVFISCGALRALDIIGELEAKIGKPAICSNQAFVWHMLRLAGIDDRIEGYGRLFSEF